MIRNYYKVTDNNPHAPFKEEQAWWILVNDVPVTTEFKTKADAEAKRDELIDADTKSNAEEVATIIESIQRFKAALKYLEGVEGVSHVRVALVKQINRLNDQLS